MVARDPKNTQNNLKIKSEKGELWEY